jgi:hypothetical protein
VFAPPRPDRVRAGPVPAIHKSVRAPSAPAVRYSSERTSTEKASRWLWAALRAASGRRAQIASTTSSWAQERGVRGRIRWMP